MKSIQKTHDLKRYRKTKNAWWKSMLTKKDKTTIRIYIKKNSTTTFQLVEDYYYYPPCNGLHCLPVLVLEMTSTCQQSSSLANPSKNGPHWIEHLWEFIVTQLICFMRKESHSWLYAKSDKKIISVDGSGILLYEHSWQWKTMLSTLKNYAWLSLQRSGPIL